MHGYQFQLQFRLQITANLTIVFEPFLPFTTAKLRSFMNLMKFD